MPRPGCPPQGQQHQRAGRRRLRQAPEDVPRHPAETARAVAQQQFGGGERGEHRARGEQRGARAQGRARRGGRRRDGERHPEHPGRRDHPGDGRTQPLRPRGRHPAARGQGQGQPGGDGRDDRGERAPRPGVGVGLGEGGRLGRQHEDEGDHPERADVRLLHDPQRVRGGLAAAQPVGGVGEPVQVQAAGEHGRYGDGGDGREEHTGAQHQQQQAHGGRRRADDQPGQRRAEHPAARGRAVPAGHPHRQDGQRAEGEPETVQRGRGRLRGGGRGRRRAGRGGHAGRLRDRHAPGTGRPGGSGPGPRGLCEVVSGCARWFRAVRSGPGRPR